MFVFVFYPCVFLMDIKEKIYDLRKLLELQTFGKDESRENLLKLLRELYLVFMFHMTDDVGNFLKVYYKKKEKRKFTYIYIYIYCMTMS